MSDSEHSTITYLTELEYSDMGSPRVDGPPSRITYHGQWHHITGLRACPEPPPRDPPIYIPYVPEPEYPEFMPPEDHVFPAEGQPLPSVVSPTADSPGYIPESDPEGDPEEADEEDPEEDPAYYPADIGDDDEEDEEEEHLASAATLQLSLYHPTRIVFPRVVYLTQKRRRLASLPYLKNVVRGDSAAGAARHDVPVIPREDPYVVAREDLYKFVDMVDVTTISMGDGGCSRDDRSSEPVRGRVNLLYRDRPIHSLAVMVEREAWMAIGTKRIGAHKTTRSRQSPQLPHQVTTTPPPVTDPTTTTSVTSAQLQAMIDEGVRLQWQARDTTRMVDDSHSSGVAGSSQNLRIALCKTMLLHGGMPMLKTTTPEAAHAMPWANTEGKKMTDKYCLRGLRSRKRNVDRADNKKDPDLGGLSGTYQRGIVRIEEQQQSGYSGWNAKLRQRPNARRTRYRFAVHHCYGLVGKITMSFSSVREKDHSYPFGDEILIVRGDGSSTTNTGLIGAFISCTLSSKQKLCSDQSPIALPEGSTNIVWQTVRFKDGLRAVLLCKGEKIADENIKKEDVGGVLVENSKDTEKIQKRKLTDVPRQKKLYGGQYEGKHRHLVSKCYDMCSRSKAETQEGPSGYDTIWVIVESTDKVCHFYAMREVESLDKLAEDVLKEKSSPAAACIYYFLPGTLYLQLVAFGTKCVLTCICSIWYKRWLDLWLLRFGTKGGSAGSLYLRLREFTRRLNGLIGEMNEACADRIAFVKELRSVAGESVPAKTAVFLEEMMNKEGSRER
ncbi:hypothetical protein Tco_0228634 [Tanacetum coccineum]